MKLKPAVGACAALLVAVLSLAGCGGGGGGSSSSSVAVANPAQFSATDVVLGSGTEAATGKTVTVTYTGWLYSDTATDHKGTQFDSGTFSFVLGQKQAITGFDQGVTGMKVGGKRTLLIPSSLGYGASGSGAIPPNAGLVFDVALTAVQ
ncbi:FKBP-type peptidyl-prolyl cis-trans isomerase [Telluria mixta]|uniref:Peptidyl-prolyl cis-trans isomerase n=1 Tax=Telluria mixta TaxID=34071 RepID=A0ABT2C734_9BURK|nr:FKBP-type peptidyl-prolyl cis-trans isomerase [Telluria mixta]MCS0632596.1 FKBP-type peptidyl-prolyl cis-trans isomerase [Telluria mixta]WEM99112.1 FKBP-type peptidyl-prolyl cis-trans isomerase [Telluria mixta]